MKLTKAQRAFIAVGREEIMINIMKRKIREKCSTCDYRTFLKRMRRERKRLIREALDAYETEKLVQQASAYERGFCAGRRIK